MRMFFAPPEVKAISRYSDFGSHLGMRSFGVTLALAFFLHAGIIGVYAMMPHTKVIKIPVRAININVGAPIADAVPASDQPSVEQGGGVVAPSPDEPPVAKKEKSESPNVVSQNAPQAELEEALAAKEEKHGNKASIHVPVVKKKEKNAVEKNDAVKPAQSAAPKRYVRESPLDITKPGGAAAAPAKTEEIRQRYEQSLSVWIQQRKHYPEEVKRRNIQGEALVRVRINRQGRVLYYVVQKSAGDALLDQAAMRMVRESDPVPPLPQDYMPSEETFEFLIPVTFK